MTARIGEFNEFLRDHVNLNQARVDTLQKRVSLLDDYMSENSSLADIIEGDVIPQGSFAHKTIIKPYTGNDFDADVLLPMEEQVDWEPKKYTIELYKDLEASLKYAGKVSLGKRCVTINYANDFHIDVVPFIKHADGLSYITHRIDNKFIRQDPVAFTHWIKTNAQTTNGHLIRVIRLMKYLRDRSSIDVPSVVLTALLTDRAQGFAGANHYTNVATAFTSLLEALNNYIGWMSSPPFIDDRIGGNLADRVTQTEFRNLQSQVNTWAGKARKALDADADASVKAWQDLFGSSFGSPISTSAWRGTGFASNTSRKGTYENTRVPGEETLEGTYGIRTELDPNYHMRVIGRFSPRANGNGRFRPMASNGDLVPIGRELTFAIEDCNVTEPYDIYWKVRNAGPEAARLRNFRGEIRKAGSKITEHSQFAGAHWVEAWVVKDGIAVATARQDVTIMHK